MLANSLAENCRSFPSKGTQIQKLFFTQTRRGTGLRVLAALAHRIVRSGYFTKNYRILLMGRRYTSSLRKFTPQWAKNIYDTKIIQVVKMRS